jgi:hypothetical protein
VNPLAVADEDLANMADRQADHECELSTEARTIGDDVTADWHLMRGQKWLRVGEILRDMA